MSSDISDVDEDNVQPTKKTDFKNLCKVASKGWDTCFIGFNDNVKNLTKPASKRPLSPKCAVPSVKCQNSSLAVFEPQLKRHSLPNACQKSCLKDANLSIYSVVQISQKLPSKPYHRPALNLAKENLSLKLNKVLEDFDSGTKIVVSPRRPKRSNSMRCKAERAKCWTFSDLCNSFDLSSKQEMSSPPISESSSTSSLGSKSEQKSIHSAGSLTAVKIEDNESPVICTYSSNLSVKESQASHNTEDKRTHNLHSHLQSKDRLADISHVKDETSEICDKNKLANSLRASDWLQTIKWQKDNSASTRANHYEDKSSKSMKFISGGFAEQAWKLENKERTARVIWSHKKSEKSEKLIHKSLTLMLQTSHNVDGFVLSKCKVMKGNVPSSTTATSSSSDNSSSDIFADTKPTIQIRSNICEKAINNYSEDVGNGKNVDEYIVLLLKLTSLNNLQLSCGSIIQVYPPWQSLNIPSIPYQVILCAHFIEVIKAAQNKDSKKSDGLSEVVIFSRNYKLASPLFAHQHRFRRKENIPSKKCMKVAEAQLISKYFMPVTDLNNQTINAATDVCVSGNCAISDTLNSSLNISPVYSSKSKISLCARIQRIWRYRDTDKNSYVETSVQGFTDIRYSLLLQDKNCKFWELQIVNFHDLSDDNKWLHVLTKGEGKCFKFENIKIAEKLQSAKHVNLFSFVKSMHDKQQKNSVTLSSLYKVTACCIQSSVADVSDSLFPQYTACETLPLNVLFQPGSHFRRFSSVAKVICDADNIFYVADASLHSEKCSPYVKLQFHLSGDKPGVPLGSVVLIKEAAVCKDMLVIDKYAKATVFSPPLLKKVKDELCHFVQQKELFKSVKELLFLKLLYSQFKPLNKFSEVLDLVTVEGRVISVDRETAVSWLQCSNCHKENLYEDMNSRIYCETCGKIINKAVLMMKMSVTVSILHLSSVTVIVELCSSTTKKVLKITDEELQPKCDIMNVLDKNIGPLVCCVKNRRGADNQLRFELYEVNISR